MNEIPSSLIIFFSVFAGLLGLAFLYLFLQELVIALTLTSWKNDNAKTKVNFTPPPIDWQPILAKIKSDCNIYHQELMKNMDPRDKLLADIYELSRVLSDVFPGADTHIAISKIVVILNRASTFIKEQPSFNFISNVPNDCDVRKIRGEKHFENFYEVETHLAEIYKDSKQNQASSEYWCKLCSKKDQEITKTLGELNSWIKSYNIANDARNKGLEKYEALCKENAHLKEQIGWLPKSKPECEHKFIIHRIDFNIMGMIQRHNIIARCEKCLEEITLKDYL